ncbi:E3 ubiquitin-protein ligase spl2 [Thalictrum thalictroides]|uniref:RING-type E3 ubiquitin transferase n=1 Tax=Thalictrum thalictroides TaxID=46969 RepID=A0A7J6W4Q1_THATH|nr:E3 ubiquitin-protein ligase spl2 [Thalictrum thalictroides]
MTLLAEFFPPLCSFVAGLAIGYGAIKCWRYADSHPDHYVLEKIRQAKDVGISDVHAFISGSESSDEKLVAVRGIVETHSTNWWRWLRPPEILVSKFGVKGVALEQTHAYIVISKDFEEIEEGLFWYFINLYNKYWSYEKYTSLTTVPFILTESGSGSSTGSQSSSSDYVSVTWGAESTHMLPLQTVSLHTHCIEYPQFLFNFLGVGPLGLIEEKMIRLGKEFTVIGICSLQDGKPQIKPCEDLPVFLTEWTKEELVTKLSRSLEKWYLDSDFLGFVALILLGLSLIWAKTIWKEWKLQSRKKDGADVDQGNGKRPALSKSQ